MLHLPTRVEVQSSIGEQAVEFRCARCGFRTHVWVKAAGTGLAINRISVSNAALDARVDATRSAELCPCPRCGHRSRAALGRLLCLGAVIGTVAGIAAGAIAVEQFHAVRWGQDAGLTAGGLAFLATGAITVGYMLRRARRRVEFVRP